MTGVEGFPKKDTLGVVAPEQCFAARILLVQQIFFMGLQESEFNGLQRQGFVQQLVEVASPIQNCATGLQLILQLIIHCKENGQHLKTLGWRTLSILSIVSG